ncbi:MAG: transglutaminase family protein [Saprospiraceae bacterium]|nr:transglutaminase family protein [Saprospiraceae bacterium]MBK6478156.1 transglutaminase family protein [Saprospiraceae bacterium]MBK7373064.1 transglutaminase family protein [Saprospiraceae bacterium]MBK8513232.1 transglutaminase family protein [Saprospiraceae bacterium]MBP8940575.1 transglutaminase family protein [Saprospiraceae bacterium]
MPKYSLKHHTKYTYTGPVRELANQIMLFPFNDTQQEVKKHEITISGDPEVEVFVDNYGNQVGIFSITGPLTELSILSQLEISVNPTYPPADKIDAATQWKELSQLANQFPYIDFLWQEKFEAQSELFEVIKATRFFTKSPFVAAQEMSTYVYNHFEYKQGITDVETGIDEIWKIKGGVCQDFARVLLIMLRHTGIPARYVSGYICPKNHDLRGEGATHAWVEAYLPNDGWVGLDPTNNCIVEDKHIRLAIGRNFEDCTPVKGTYKGNTDHTLEVHVTIDGEGTNISSNQPNPAFSYQTQKKSTDNSYRKFIEQQQQ